MLENLFGWLKGIFGVKPEPGESAKGSSNFGLEVKPSTQGLNLVMPDFTVQANTVMGGFTVQVGGSAEVGRDFPPATPTPTKP